MGIAVATPGSGLSLYADGALAHHEYVSASGIPRYDRRQRLDTVREFSVVEPWRAVWAIALGWVTIGLALTGALVIGHWAAYLGAAIIMASDRTRSRYLCTKARTGDSCESEP